jgi:hypothetical protein
MRSAACAVLLSGCLIVHTDEEIVDDPCPTEAPQVLADASGPFVVSGDVIYFVGANGVLSRVSIGGGPVSELSSEHVRVTSLVADGTDLYWAGDGAILRKPLDSGPYTIAEGYPDVSHVVIDDTSVAWASSSGLDRWSKLDETITHLDDVSLVLGLGVSDGIYYFSDRRFNQVRKTPPTIALADVYGPGPLVVDDKGVYFYSVEDPFLDHGGAIRLVPRDGGTVITTVDRVSLVLDLASDETHLYFITVYGNDYRIQYVSRFGGEVRTLACGTSAQQRMYVAVDAEFVYWADERALYRIEKFGSPNF